MFRKTNAQQALFGASSRVGESVWKRLKETWAEGFRQEVLGLLMEVEPEFSGLYGDRGRPNYSVGRILGICLLQEMHALSDQAALDSLSFDSRWQHALDATEEQAYLSRRSLVEFRRRLVEHDPEMALMRMVFDRISEGAIAKLSLSTAEQRLDSTLAMSNIRTAGLLELFRSTTQHFLNALDSAAMATVPQPIRTWHEHSADGWFGLGPAKRRNKLDELTQWVHTLIDLFSQDPVVSQIEPYALLQRVFEEHCERVQTEPRGKDDSPKGSADSGKDSRHVSEPKIVLRHRHGGTMQSPHDPDAQYGHNGIGYKMHVTETCNNDKQTEIITDYEVHGNSRSDMGKAKDVISRLDGLGKTPTSLYADAGYPTPQLLHDLAKRGIDLVAPVHRGRLDDEVMSRQDFSFDDGGRVRYCPQGHRPIDHRVQNPNGEGRHLHAFFDGQICRSCPALQRCPVRAPNHRSKGCHPTQTTGDFRLDISPALQARDRRWVQQQQKSWRDRYKIRAGVEGTISELKRAHGLGKLRVRRLPRVHFALVCKVAACNVKRWLRAGASTRLGRLLRAIFVPTPLTGHGHTAFPALTCVPSL